jgi:hypothetical protein
MKNSSIFPIYALQLMDAMNPIVYDSNYKPYSKSPLTKKQIKARNKNKRTKQARKKQRK